MTSKISYERNILCQTTSFGKELTLKNYKAQSLFPNRVNVTTEIIRPNHVYSRYGKAANRPHHHTSKSLHTVIHHVTKPSPIILNPVRITHQGRSHIVHQWLDCLPNAMIDQWLHVCLTKANRPHHMCCFISSKKGQSMDPCSHAILIIT